MAEMIGVITMATCKECVHCELCRCNTYQQAKYFGKDKEIYITLDNNSPCRFFKNKADFVEVKHGEWERVKKLNVAVNPYQHTCGICGKSYFDHIESNYPHCPYCGADMRKEGADNG